MGAHDGGTSPPLGCPRSRQSGLAKELFSTAEARERRGREQPDPHPWSKLNGELALQESGEHSKALRVRAGPDPPVHGRYSRQCAEPSGHSTGILPYHNAFVAAERGRVGQRRGDSDLTCTSQGALNQGSLTDVRSLRAAGGHPHRASLAGVRSATANGPPSRRPVWRASPGCSTFGGTSGTF
jgi:hypothetical protein